MLDFLTKVALLLGLVLPSFLVGGQVPIVENYLPEDYNGGAKNWCFEQTDEGVLYVGNDEGFLIFDGTSWGEIPVPGKTPRSMCFNQEGHLVMAISHRFGKLVPDSAGSLQYHSMMDLVPKEHNNINLFWSLYQIDGKYYADNMDKIFRIDPTDSSNTKVWDTESNVIRGFKVNGEVYYEMNAVKVKTLESGRLVDLPALKRASEGSIMGMLAFSNNSVLTFTQDSGLFLYNQPQQQIIPYGSEEVNAWCKKHEVYATAILRKKGWEKTYYAIGTMEDGILIIDEEGGSVHEIAEEQGLCSNHIETLHFDQEQGMLWAGTDRGISKIDLDLPIVRYDEHHNVPADVYSILQKEGDLYIGTDVGLFLFEEEKDQFVPLLEEPAQCWNLMDAGEGIFVAGGNSGFFHVKGREVVANLVMPTTVFDVLPSQQFPNLYFLGTYSGLVVLERSPQGFKEIGRVPEMERLQCRQVEETKNALWVNPPNKGFARIRFDAAPLDSTLLEEARVDYYARQNGLDTSEPVRIQKTSMGVLFKTMDSLYSFDAEKEEFISKSKLNKGATGEGLNSIIFEESPTGDLWFPNSKEIARKTEEGYEWDTTTFKVIPEPQTPLYFSNTSTVWMGGNRLVLRFQDKERLKEQRTRNPVIRKVVSGEQNPKVIFGGVESAIDKPPSLTYENNGVIVHFSTPDFRRHEETKYRFQLKGYEASPSNWGKQTRKEYTNLREGKYVFKIWSKNALGVIAGPATYSFKVLPPWYRTGWAYTGFGITGVLGIWLLVWVNSRRLMAQKKKLENEVAKATQTIRQQKQEVEVKKEEVEEAHREITDSINYAQRIQTALLQPEEHVSVHLPPHFILFKPQATVSGDFYWSQEREGYLYLAVMDCTGHGVPGAFMSMLGVSFLNEILAHETLPSPGEVLTQLRERVVKELSTNGKEIGAKDGMDAAMVRIPLGAKSKEWGEKGNGKREKGNGKDGGTEANKPVQFAGANNPLYIINNGIGNHAVETRCIASLQNQEPTDFIKPFKKTPDGVEIKPDKMAVGYEEHVQGDFQTKEVEIPSGAMIYLFSDGYADQFGGPKGKKFRYGPFKQLLVDIHQKPLEEQKTILDQVFEDWKNESDQAQVDDVCVIGVQV